MLKYKHYEMGINRAFRLLVAKLRTGLVWFKPTHRRVMFGLVALVIAITQLIPIFQPHVEAQRYDLNQVNHLLPRQSDLLAQKLTLNGKAQTYDFNQDYTPSTTGPMDTGGYKKNGSSKIKATAGIDATKGVKVTDPINNIDFTLTPKMDLLPAKQDSNRVYYPLRDGSGWLIYTMQADQVAEDLVLTRATGDTLEYKYDLGLGDALAAKMQQDGSVGIYGSELPLNGQVSTGSTKDAELLAKARKAAAKTKLLFTLPAPIIRQSNAGETKVEAHFTFKGSELTLHASGLKTGQYPLSIDPSVYVSSAQGLMYGNNETNVNFDTTNNLFQKTTVSGGNIRDGVSQTSWTTTTALPTGLWNSGVAISGGYIYVVGGTNSSNAATSAVYYAKLNVSSTVAIGAWATNSSYNLPSARSGVSVTAYNDFLYLIGGDTPTNQVYAIRLAASGEPTPSWVLQTNTLPQSLARNRAVAFENQIYVVGGVGSSGSTSSSTVTASLNPDGTVGTWSGTTSMPAARYGNDLLTYNGYIYAVGGLSGSTPNNNVAVQNTIYYAKILSPGVLGAWQTNTNNLSTARYTSGGTFATIWAGYMYLSGGCSTTTGNNSLTCSNILGDTQIASINADGSISTWTTLQTYNTGTSSFVNISQPRTGFGLVSFGTANNPSAANAGGTLYAVGGCGAAPNTSNVCATPLTTTSAADISSEGDLGPSRLTTSLPSGAGAFAAAIAVNNGYIYNIGGCTNNACNASTNTIWYAQLNADGTIGSWTQTTTGLPVNRTAAGATIFGDVIYVFGGTNGGTNSAGATAYSAPILPNGNITGTTTNTTATMTVNNNGLAAAVLYPFVFATVNNSAPTTGYVYTAGGCTSTSAIGCSGYVATVRRCTVTIGSAALTNCVGTATNASGILQLPDGTGIAAGAVYGSYVYLSSGANNSDSTVPGEFGGQTNLTYYVEIDSNGLLVQPPGKSGTTWPTTSGKLASNGKTSTAAGQRRRAAAFAVNGYLYVLGGHDGSSSTAGLTLQDMEIGKIDPTTGDIASFVDNYYQITPRWDFKGAAANGYIYAVGGCSTGYPPGNCTGTDRAVQYMQLYNNNSGTPASYIASANTPSQRTGASSAIYNGYIYLAGGSPDGLGNDNNIGTVQYAQIQADGTIGTWNNTISTQSRYNGKLVVYDGYFYFMGGKTNDSNSSINDTIDRAQINADGTLTSMSSPGSFGGGSRQSFEALAYQGKMYVMGGSDASSTLQNSVYVSTITNGNLSVWTATSSFTTARSNFSSVAYNGALYIIGGTNGTILSDVQFAKVNNDGTLGSFTNAQGLPQPVAYASAFAANGYLYLVGGAKNLSTTGCTNNTYVAPFSANNVVNQSNPSAATSNAPNGIGNWTQTAVQFGTAALSARTGHTASYANGKVYIMGGVSCQGSGMVNAANNVYYGTLQSQPQVASYSYAIDAINDVFPSKSLFNGIDNGIGASWVLDYRSSTDATKLWGRNTAYGKTTLGTPQPYIPYNAAGANTSFARYYWIKLSIDASQAFGYPEDVSRGPTIANLTLQFTANPSQRLRNGKTFINNVEQPLDAPF